MCLDALQHGLRRCSQDSEPVCGGGLRTRAVPPGPRRNHHARSFPEGTTLAGIGPDPTAPVIGVSGLFVNYQTLEVVDPAFLSVSGRVIVGDLPLVDQDTTYQVVIRAKNSKGSVDATIPITVTNTS